MFEYLHVEGVRAPHHQWWGDVEVEWVFARGGRRVDVLNSPWGTGGFRYCSGTVVIDRLTCQDIGLWENCGVHWGGGRVVFRSWKYLFTFYSKTLRCFHVMLCRLKLLTIASASNVFKKKHEEFKKKVLCSSIFLDVVRPSCGCSPLSRTIAPSTGGRRTTKRSLSSARNVRSWLQVLSLLFWGDNRDTCYGKKVS